MPSRFFNNKFFVMALLLPFFIPMALQYIPATLAIYEVLQLFKLIVFCFIFVQYFLKYKFRFSRLDLFIALFGFIYIVTSYVANADYSKPMTSFLLSLSPVFLVRIFMKENPTIFVKCFMIWSFFSLYINFLCTIVFPGGLPFAILYKNLANPLYLYTIDNGMGKFLIMPTFLSFFYYVQKKNMAVLIVNILVICSTICIVDSATGICVIALLTLLSALSVFYGIRVRKKYMLFAILFFEVCVVVLGNSFGWIHYVTDFFGRNSDFTGRDFLWAQSLNMIYDMPWSGYGYSSGILSVWGGDYSSHNLYLELILHGGPFLLIVFLIILFYVLKRIKERKCLIQYMVFLAIVSFLVIGLFEVGINTMYYFFLAFAIYGFGYTKQEKKSL